MLVVPLLGDARAGTWSQAARFCLVTAGFVSVAALWPQAPTGNTFAPAAYGVAPPEIDKLEFGPIGQKLADAASLKRFPAPFLTLNRLNFAAVTALSVSGSMPASPIGPSIGVQPSRESAA
jgi:hypothetical protein